MNDARFSYYKNTTDKSYAPKSKPNYYKKHILLLIYYLYAYDDDGINCPVEINKYAVAIDHPLKLILV